MICTVALEARSNPTLTFSLFSCLDWWHSAELFGSAVAAGGVGTAAVGPAVALEPEYFTVLSYKDTMLWKAAGGPGCDEVSFFNVTLAG